MTPYQYSEEQIFIRAMPCPKCGAAPREHCNRKPKDNGMIKNHQERLWEWHKFVQSKRTESSVSFRMNLSQSGKMTLDLIDDDDKFG